MVAEWFKSSTMFKHSWSLNTQVWIPAQDSDIDRSEVEILCRYSNSRAPGDKCCLWYRTERRRYQACPMSPVSLVFPTSVMWDWSHKYGGLKTGLKEACLWSKMSGIQIVRQVMWLYHLNIEQPYCEVFRWIWYSDGYCVWLFFHTGDQMVDFAVALGRGWRRCEGEDRVRQLEASLVTRRAALAHRVDRSKDQACPGKRLIAP